MAMILIQRDRTTSEEFDPAAIRDRMIETFPQVVFDVGDQSVAEAGRAKAWADEQPGDKSHVVKSLEQKARESGPAYSFRMDLVGTLVWGTVRRIDVTILCEQRPPDSAWSRLVRFAKDLGVGKVSVDTGDLPNGS